MRIHEVEVFNEQVHELAEGPVAYGADGQLLWVDIEGCAIHRGRDDGALTSSIATPQRVGMAVPTGADGTLWAGEDGLFHHTRRWGHERLLSCEPGKPTRFNDGKVAPDGSLWVGTMGMGQRGVGSLYRFVAPDRPGRVLLTGITCSNGLAWTPDMRTFYYIDTPRRRVEAFSWDPSSECLTDRRTVVAFTGDIGHPDGMCIDDDGRLWVAHWGGWQVSCWDPATGRQCHSIPLPVANVTSCCFCGPERCHLLITTARAGNTAEALAEQPHAGKLFVACVPASGPPAVPLGEAAPTVGVR